MPQMQGQELVKAPTYGGITLEAHDGRGSRAAGGVDGLPASTGEIGGQVWVDVNMDGIRGAHDRELFVAKGLMSTAHNPLAPGATRMERRCAAETEARLNSRMGRPRR